MPADSAALVDAVRPYCHPVTDRQRDSSASLLGDVLDACTRHGVALADFARPHELATSLVNAVYARDNRGACQVCGRPYALLADGTVRGHNAKSGTRPCGGTRQPPLPAPARPAAPTVLDGLVREEAPDA